MAENEKQEQKLLWMQSSPHIVRKDDVQCIMQRVIISLLPVTIFGIVYFGFNALLNVVVSVVFAVIGEAVFRRLTKQEIRISDCSAVVTGLLLALVIPPATPLWMTALGSLFAIIIVKEFFGGLGANVFNPALGGRAFLLMSFPAALTTWSKGGGAFTADSVSTATPLGILKEGAGAADAATHATGILAPVKDVLNVTDGDLLKDLFLGTRAGCIGETSILLILAGAVFLVVTKVIDLRTPLAMVITAFLAALVIEGNCEYAVFTLLSGGLLFGAVFMATDYTSTPVTSAGKIIFGIGAGLIVVLVRKFGAYPEGVMFSILIMNAVTPFLNKILHKKYGFVKPKPAAAGGTK